MKINLTACFSFVFLILGSGCLSQKKDSRYLYLLNIKILHPGLMKQVYLTYEDEQGKQITDSVTAKNGIAVFKGSIIHPQSALLEVSSERTGMDTSELARQFNPRNIVGQLDLYLEPGTLSVEAANDSLKDGSIKGGKMNSQFAQLNQLLDVQNKRIRDLNTLYATTDTADTVALQHIEAQIAHIANDTMSRIYKDFFTTHPTSYIGLYALVRYTLYPVSSDSLMWLSNKLPEKLLVTRLGIFLQERIKALRSTHIGQMAQEVVQPDTAGRPVHLSSFKGKYVLLDFWASWCMPCRVENPGLRKAYEQYAASGFDILSVSLDVKREKWLDAIRSDSLQWQQVSDLTAQNKAAKTYGIIAIPQNFLINPQGRIIAIGLRGEALQWQLAKLFLPAVKNP